MRGGGVVWRRGQRQQRQQRLAGGSPAGQPREQRGGGGLGRGQQHGRGRDPGAQPEQPGRAGHHPDPGRRRRVRIHPPEERLPPPLEPGARQHPTSPRGRAAAGRRGRGRRANSLGSAARPLAPPRPARGAPPPARAPRAPRARASGPRGWRRAGDGGAPGRSPGPPEAAGPCGRNARRRRPNPHAAAPEAEVAAQGTGTSCRRAGPGAPAGTAPGPPSAWLDSGQGRGAPRGAACRPRRWAALAATADRRISLEKICPALDEAPNGSSALAAPTARPRQVAPGPLHRMSRLSLIRAPCTGPGFPQAQNCVPPVPTARGLRSASELPRAKDGPCLRRTPALACRVARSLAERCSRAVTARRRAAQTLGDGPPATDPGRWDAWALHYDPLPVKAALRPSLAVGSSS